MDEASEDPSEELRASALRRAVSAALGAFAASPLAPLLSPVIDVSPSSGRRVAQALEALRCSGALDPEPKLWKRQRILFNQEL